MRKSQLLIVFILIIACLCACTNVEIHGIENFDQATCSVGLTKNLFPGEGFLESYDYLESDYYYFDACELVWGYAEAYAILTYDERIYTEAKAYCLERFAVCELHQYVCEQYTFYEVKNADSYEVDPSGDVACNFPELFNLFAYNDETCSLVFLGYYDGDPKSQNRKLAEADFYAFINNTYQDFFADTVNDSET